MAGGYHYGHAVAVSGDVVVVAAPGGDDVGEDTGSVFVYRVDGDGFWIEEQRLNPGDAAIGDRFGESVAIDGDWIAVGAVGDDDGGVNAGSVYLFHWNGSVWEEEGELFAGDASAGDGLGCSVSLSGGMLLAGAAGHDGGGSNSGAAYVFGLDGASWSEEQTILMMGGGSGLEELGACVSVSDGVAVLGAPGDDPLATGSGAVHVYAAGRLSGSVNAGLGDVTNVLLVDGVAGGTDRRVELAVGSSFTVSLEAAPAGPAPGKYVMWVWSGDTTTCLDLEWRGEMIGPMAGRTPLHSSGPGLPVRCLKGDGVPLATAAGLPLLGGAPATVPWSLSPLVGYPVPATFLIQGVVEDAGAGSSHGYSTTNALIVEIR